MDQDGQFGVGRVLVEDEEQFGLEGRLEFEEVVRLLFDFG